MHSMRSGATSASTVWSSHSIGADEDAAVRDADADDGADDDAGEDATGDSVVGVASRFHTNHPPVPAPTTATSATAATTGAREPRC